MHNGLDGIFIGLTTLSCSKKCTLVCGLKNLRSFDHHPHEECLYSSICQCQEHDVIKCRHLTKLSGVRDYTSFDIQ